MTYLYCFLISLVLGLIFCALLVPYLKKIKAGQSILSYVVEHSSKQGTPTMGGIAFLLSMTLALCLCQKDWQQTTLTAVVVVLAFGVVGFLDDFIKLKYKRNEGLKAYQKIIFQLAIAVGVALYVYLNPITNQIKIPFFGNFDVNWWVIPLVIFVFLATTNGVNLTDGLDGLATTTTFVYLVGMAVLLGVESNKLQNFGETLSATATSQLCSLCCVGAGSLLAFLPFNAFPAKVFMGDVGSLGLGALVACVSTFSGYTLYIPILGIMYVVSCLSVILQVAYFKVTNGKRIFLMAPFHHHLQHKGWSETRIATVYCLVTIFMFLVLLWEVFI